MKIIKRLFWSTVYFCLPLCAWYSGMTALIQGGRHQFLNRIGQMIDRNGYMGLEYANNWNLVIVIVFSILAIGCIFLFYAPAIWERSERDDSL